MTQNLPILPLHTIDSLSYQKCLIPKHNFHKTVRPGQWGKCYFVELTSGKQYYAVTQIFPRADLDGVCYLDTCVSNYYHETDSKFILNKFVSLEAIKEIEVANVKFQLNPYYFIENSHLFSKAYLQKLAKILLQKYYMTDGIIIRDSFLLGYGVDSIYLEIAENCDESTRKITDNTTINIKNVTLKCEKFTEDLIPLNVEPFINAVQELEALMKSTRSQQRFGKRLLCMSLNAIIVGAVGCGKTRLVEDFLQSHRCNVFRINITNCLKQYPGEAEAELRKIFHAACDFEIKFKSNDPTVILLEEIHLFTPQTTSTGNISESLSNSMRICAQLLSLVDRVFNSKRHILCLATTSKPEDINELVRRPGRFENEISIAALQEQHRSEILRELLKQSMQNFIIKPATLETMAKHTQGYVIADLALLVRQTTLAILTKPQISFDDIVVEILKKSKPISLKGTDVSAYKTTETFDSIGGMFHLKKILEVSVLSGLKQQKSFQRFGLSLPKGVLLYGPPGCAKTTIAKCLATEANMTFIATSSAEVYSPYVGCAEKFIAKIFQVARKNSPSLIFLDEIDSLVGRRAITGSSSDVQTRILSTLLTEMDGVIAPFGLNSHIIVVAATNRPNMVDDALMRPGRFDKLIHVPAPDLLSRRSILDLYNLKMPFSKSLDLDYVAHQTENYSGADICNLCNEAALQAFQRDFNSQEILMEDFENVLKVSKSSLFKSQIDSYYEFENKFL